MRRRRAAAEPRIRRGAAQGHGDADRVVRRQREVLRGVRRERFDLGVRQRTRRVVEPVGGVGSRYVARRGLVQELRGRQRRRPRLSKERVVALGQDAADVELFLERGERFFVFCGAVRDAQFRASELRDEIRRRVFEVGHEHAAGREAAPRDDARRRGGSTLELLERQRQRFALRDERDRRRPTPRGGRRELVEGHMIELAQGCVSGLCSREPT